MIFQTLCLLTPVSILFIEWTEVLEAVRGVCLLLKYSTKLVVSLVNIPSEFARLEILAIDVGDSMCMPFRLVVAYRPPSYSASDNILLFSSLTHLAASCARFCLLGDLNLPDFNWDLFIHPDNVLYNSASDFVCTNGLTQLVNQPTRGDSILDYVFCSDTLCCDNLLYFPPLAHSDHCIVSFTLALSMLANDDVVDVAKPSYIPNYTKANWPALCEYLQSVDWVNEHACCTSAASMWDRFIGLVTIGVEMYVPSYKSDGPERGRIHYPMRITKLFHKKACCWRLYRRFPTAAIHEKYKRLSKACSCAVRQFQANFETRLVDSGNLGSFYKYVNKKLNGSNGIAPLRDESGNSLASNADKAALLNRYFSSVFTTDNGIIDSNRLPNQIKHKMLPVCFTPQMVMKFIQKLNASGGGGPDGLPACFFKTTASIIGLPLSIIFNLSLQTGVIPEIWKQASIVPVFKKGSPGDPCNYRPISLTCIACKLMECGIKDAILAFLKEHKLINASQHGFMANKSTTTHLLECNLDWNAAIRSKHGVDIAYLDFAKAFDSVVHTKLIAKLRCYGICDMLLSWIESFLSNRYQFVRIGSSVSPICSVLSGVPQGSVLGPVLFILYVNDIVGCMANTVSIKLFADDAKIYTVISETSSTHLQSSLDAVVSWADHWQLKLSPTKCSVMRIAYGQRSLIDVPVYKIAHYALPVITQCTDLGVSYDTHLSFSAHISRIVSIASGRAKCILKCFSSRDSSLLLRAFCTFVRPLLEFSSIIWSPYYKKNINKLESVQRSFTKAIDKLHSCSYKERLLNLNLVSLQHRRLISDLLMCYKILHGLVDIDAPCFFTRAHCTSTRGNSLKLAKIPVVSERDKNFYCNRIVNIWNNLPDHVVTSSSIAGFKRSIYRLDFSQYLLF